MKIVLMLSGALAGLSVVLGAFAAHGLKNRLEEHLLSAFQTGVTYQMYHALALMLVVILSKLLPHVLWSWTAGLFIAGIVCFSGSLYALALTGLKWFGPITPLGGLLFIIGWVLFIVATMKAL